MDSYKVIISPKAYEQLENYVEYIQRWGMEKLKRPQNVYFTGFCRWAEHEKPSHL